MHVLYCDAHPAGPQKVCCAHKVLSKVPQAFLFFQSFVVTYNVATPETFKLAVDFIEHIQSKARDRSFVGIILVGDKTDPKEKRSVSVEEGMKLAAKHRIGFIETCSVTGNGLFNAALTQIIYFSTARRGSAVSTLRCPYGLFLGCLLQDISADFDTIKSIG